jgi:effector-binding domain-containing protein
VERLVEQLVGYGTKNAANPAYNGQGELLMHEDFEVIEKSMGSVIEIEERVPVWRMPATFGRDYKRIADYIQSQGAEIVDMPFARYLDMDWEKEINRGKLAMFFTMFTKQWHFYVGMSASKELLGEGELKSQVLPRQRYARAVHKGPYQECGATYKALFDWVKSQNLSPQNQAIECYANDPHVVDKADIETVILIPLK